MTKNTAHSDCTHPKTKAARAACRKTKSATPEYRTVETVYGVSIRVMTITAREITKNHQLFYETKSAGNFFSPCTYDAFQQEIMDHKTMSVRKTDRWTIYPGGQSKTVTGDTEFVVAVDSDEVKAAQAEHSRRLRAPFSKS